jgi:non-ribosomal peptide synthetase component F
LRESKRAVTPYGGLAVFIEYLQKICYSETIQANMPVTLTSRNAINPTETFTAFLISVLSGVRRFAQAGLQRKQVLHMSFSWGGLQTRNPQSLI